MAFGRAGDEKSPENSSGTTYTGSITPNSGKVEAFLGKGSKVVGTVSFTGPAELDGYVEGEVNAKELLTVGESAVVNAKVIGSEILVRGTITGDIVASKRLSLKRPAKVVGNISSTNLSIEEGVIFEGKCVMNGSTAQNEQKPLSAKPNPIEKLGATV